MAYIKRVLVIWAALLALLFVVASVAFWVAAVFILFDMGKTLLGLFVLSVGVTLLVALWSAQA